MAGMIAEEWLSRIPGLARRRNAGEFDAALFAALYFLHWQIATHGRGFAARKNRNNPRPDAREWAAVLESASGQRLRGQLLDWLTRYQFRGVIANVPVAIIRWLRGDWPLQLCEEVPGAREVLRCQARGTRVVTAVTQYPRMRAPVLNKPDAFAFFLHDLEHAYKFFHSPPLHAGQCAFFAALETALERGVFDDCLGDACFSEKFHYLMSDMNTHPEHSRQYLRAVLIEHYLHREGKQRAAPLSAAAELCIARVMRAIEPPTPCAQCA